ncbi:hypothetical protein D3C80_910130 [compost metagenome]
MLARDLNAGRQGHFLCCQTGYLFLHLPHFLVRYGNFRSIDVATGFEYSSLSDDNGVNGRIVRSKLFQLRRKQKLHLVGLFSYQPSLARLRVPQLPLNTDQFRPGLCIVQLDQNLTVGNQISIVDINLLNDTAFQMLNGLAAGFRFDNPHSDRCTFKRCENCPYSKACNEDQYEQVSCPGYAAQPWS